MFTFNDAVRASGKERAYVKIMLSRMVSRGTLHRAERGVYYSGKATALEIASSIVQPSYVSLTAALNYYGVTMQIPILTDVITSKRHRALDLWDGTRVTFRTVKREKMFGFHREAGNISIADPEKAFVDALYFMSPGAGEIGEAFETAMRKGVIDMGKMTEYARRMRSKALLKRLDTLMESERG